MADGSPRTDISTDDTDEKNQRVTLFPLHHLFFRTSLMYKIAHSDCKETIDSSYMFSVCAFVYLTCLMKSVHFIGNGPGVIQHIWRYNI